MTGFLLVVSALLASLALGVLAAYGVCHGMFQLFRAHALSAARTRIGAGALQTSRS